MNLTQLSPPDYIGWTGRGSSLCRLADLYGYSAERSQLTIISSETPATGDTYLFNFLPIVQTLNLREKGWRPSLTNFHEIAKNELGLNRKKLTFAKNLKGFPKDEKIRVFYQYQTLQNKHCKIFKKHYLNFQFYKYATDFCYHNPAKTFR